MKAFTDTEVTKDRLIASLEAHRAADRLIQGNYWTGNGKGRGCAVGCSLHDFRKGEESNHALYEPLFGVPRMLARLEDLIFERLPIEEAREWPLRFTQAIPEGADLSRVCPAFLYRVIERRRRALDGLSHLGADVRTKVQEAQDAVLKVLAEWRDTGVRPGSVSVEAADAAWAARRFARAAADAAWAHYRGNYAAAAAAAAAAADAAADAAAAAADAAADDADAAADDAAAAADDDDAWSAYRRTYGTALREEYRWMADVLIEEIERSAVEVTA